MTWWIILWWQVRVINRSSIHDQYKTNKVCLIKTKSHHVSLCVWICNFKINALRSPQIKVKSTGCFRVSEITFLLISQPIKHLNRLDGSYILLSLLHFDVWFPKKCHNHSVIIHLWRLRRCIIADISKIHWKSLKIVRVHLCTNLNEIWYKWSQDSNWPPHKISWRSELSLRRYLQNNTGVF